MYYKIVNKKKEEKTMRNFVVRFGGYVVDIMAIVTLIGLVLSTIKVIQYQGWLAGLGVFWAGLVSFVFVFFLIYLVMSINIKLGDEKQERY